METFTITNRDLVADLPEIPEDKAEEIRAAIASYMEKEIERLWGFDRAAREAEWRSSTYTYPPKPKPQPRGFLGFFNLCSS